MNLLFQLLFNGLVNGAMFAVMACAFGLVYRSARVFHVAFAGLFMVAPYTAIGLIELHFPFWLAIALGIGTASVAAMLTESTIYRPLLRRDAGSGATMVASLGAFIVIENFLAMIFGSEARSFNRGDAHRFAIGPVSATNIQLIQLMLATATVAALGVATKTIGAFQVIWAMGDEPEMIQSLGLPLNRFRLLLFAVSGAVGGIAACLIGWDVGVNPHDGMSFLLIAAVAVLAGGRQQYCGWIVGGFLVALLQSVVVWRLSANWMDFATFSVLLGVLAVCPGGLLSLRKRLEEK